MTGSDDETTAPTREAGARARQGLVVLVAVAAVVAIVAAALTFLRSQSEAGTTLVPQAARKGGAREAKPVNLGKLPVADTHATLTQAPRDPDPAGSTGGEVVRARQVLPVYAAPGRRPFAKVGPEQIGELWLPVIDRQGGWSQVLLPSRPNGATGWIRTAQVERRTSPYLVKVHVGSRTLELFYEGESAGTWPVAVGAPGTPTPTGRTFVLGSITDPNQSYSPVILPLGTHSDTLDTYGGGPGTVALHTWPDASVFGTAASHGCVRVPAEALDRLTEVPLGSLVVIDDN